MRLRSVIPIKAYAKFPLSFAHWGGFFIVLVFLKRRYQFVSILHCYHFRVNSYFLEMNYGIFRRNDMISQNNLHINAVSITNNEV